MHAGNVARRIFLKDARLRPIFRAIVYIVCTLFVAGVFGLAVAPILGLSPGKRTALPPFRVEAVLEVLLCVAAVGVAIVLRRFLDRRSVASLGFAFGAGWSRLLGIGILIGAGMQLLVFAIQEGLGYSHVARVASAQADALGLSQYVPFFIVVALTEEMAVRGYLFQNVWEEWGLPAAIVLTSSLFAALHLGNPNSHASFWLTITGLMFYGVWACLSYVWTKSLWVALGTHFAWNLFEGPVLGFPVSGITFGSTVVSQRIEGPAWFTGGPFGPEAGASSLIALACGVALLYWLYKRAAFASVYDAREQYALEAGARV
jgi:CAAX protease family protein